MARVKGETVGRLVGRRIAQLRTAAGLSQQALADAIGVRQATISDWERGVSADGPSAGSLVAVAAALGVTVGDLFA